MNWFKIKKMRTPPSASLMEENVIDTTTSVVETILRNSGDIDQCRPDLEKTGLPSSAILKIYNLTIFACTQDKLEAMLSKGQFPEYYVIMDEFGAEQTVQFNACDIYRAARDSVVKYPQAAASIAATSDQFKLIAACVERLGGETRENFARVLLLPPVVQTSGQAEVKATILPVVGGASQSIKRRTASELKYFKGKGIDVGGGEDSIDQYRDKLGFDSCRNWDMEDGDAQYLASVPDSTYDFLHSSHCLEHMVDPKIALINWVRVVRTGGYLVVVIPDEEMYEHLRWPSICNGDHKWSFTIYRGVPRLPKSVNVFDLLVVIWSEVEIIKIERLEAGYRDDWGDTDQTAFGTSECSIEFVLRKIAPDGNANLH